MSTGDRPAQSRRRVRRGSALALGAAVLAVLLVGAYLVGAQHRAPQEAGQGPRPSSAPPERPVAMSPSSDARASAIAWLRGYRTLSYTDPTPSAWIARVLPVVTGDLAEQYQASEGVSGGSEWTDFVAQRCQTTISGPGAVIPREAPSSTTAVYVTVTGDAISKCAVGEAPGGPIEHVSATLELVRGPDALWRTSRRIY